ncbi:MAG: diguanylate cyclase [Desulfovibrionaceae bacterium]|nr:diguanylate cyclase [Desulfovibrionaceae bacterium]MBF0514434.1 diguanylate cyclase [Desulfovibrionaceae bacterium]
MENDALKGTILIVDDNPSNIQLLGDVLEQDHVIKTAQNGPDALKIALSDQPDLILLDVMMPGMDGYQVCSELKASPETSDIPVIFLTVLNEEKNEAFGLKLGAIDYIVKPTSANIIRARVKNHIELKRYRDMLKDLGQIDGLTGIPNRRFFEIVLNKEWRRAEREKHPLSVIMIDIDNFKAFNDSNGHLAGDDCLRAVAQAIAHVLKRPGDIAARWGGEEFACVLPNIDAKSAQLMAEAILVAVRDLAIAHPSSPVAKVVTISLGTASQVDFSRGSTASLMEEADKNLYTAKSLGRNRVAAQPGMSSPETMPA